MRTQNRAKHSSFSTLMTWFACNLAKSFSFLPDKTLQTLTDNKCSCYKHFDAFNSEWMVSFVQYNLLHVLRLRIENEECKNTMLSTLFKWPKQLSNYIHSIELHCHRINSALEIYLERISSTQNESTALIHGNGTH